MKEKGNQRMSTAGDYDRLSAPRWCAHCLTWTNTDVKMLTDDEPVAVCSDCGRLKKIPRA